jgi:hypothetical protein
MIYILMPDLDLLEQLAVYKGMQKMLVRWMDLISSLAGSKA